MKLKISSEDFFMLSVDFRQIDQQPVRQHAGNVHGHHKSPLVTNGYPLLSSQYRRSTSRTPEKPDLSQAGIFPAMACPSRTCEQPEISGGDQKQAFHRFLVSSWLSSRRAACDSARLSSDQGLATWPEWPCQPLIRVLIQQKKRSDFPWVCRY